MRIVSLLVSIISLFLFSSALYAGETYNRVMKDKIVKVGVLTDSIPNSFYNDKKELVGFEIDLAAAIAKKLGCKLKLVPLKKDNSRVTKVKNGSIDLSIANMTHTRERDKEIDFSITYFLDGQRILAKKGKYKTWENFLGKRIATVKGTTTEENIKNMLRQIGDDNCDNTVIPYESDAKCFEALKSGRVAGWTGDSSILIGYAGKYPGEYEFVGGFMSKEPCAIGLQENDSAWRDIINFSLQDIWQDGTFHSIYNKWYGPDTPHSYPFTNQFEIWKDLYDPKSSSHLPI